MGSNDNLEDLPGVGSKTADSLMEEGYSTYMAIATASPGDLADQTSLGESKASDVIRAAQDEADVGGFDTGKEVLETRKEVGKLQFNIDELDELLGGGVETQSITEFYGEFGSGKSQVTHQLAVNVQLPKEHGGLGGSCIFIDTEDTFRPERIAGMVHGLPEDALEACLERDGSEYTVEDIKNSETASDGSPKEGTPAEEYSQVFLDRIYVAKAFNTNHQMLLAEKAKEQAEDLVDSDFPVGLVCVDSLTAHFRSEYVGRGELAERQQKLNQHLHDIIRTASLSNACAVVTNQVQSNPDQFFGDPTKPIGGNILAHTSNFRLYIRKSKENKRVMRLVDAPNLPDGEAITRVTGDGVVPE